MRGRQTASTKKLHEIYTPDIKYVRAVNISRDRGDRSALSGYVVTRNVAEALERITAGLGQTSTQRAWRITGPYGGGKSAFGLFLTSIFDQPLRKDNGVGKLIDRDAPHLLPKLRRLPKYLPIVITGRRADISIDIARALHEQLTKRRASKTQRSLQSQVSRFIEMRRVGKVPPEDLLDLVTECTAFFMSGVAAADGVLLILDEMGHFLEYSADSKSDLSPSFFQSLAEMAGGATQNRLAIVAFLHQRFEDYAASGRAERDQRQWSKIAERFEDVVFTEPFESSCELLARGLNVNQKALVARGIDKRSISLYRKALKVELLQATEKQRIAEFAPRLFPLHPATLSALFAYTRRLAQNERSLFSFILSSEPFGIRDFSLRTTVSGSSWYRLSHFCDYLLAQGSIRAKDEERQNRWRLLQETLRSAPLFSAQELDCLKVVGLLNVIEPTPGLEATATTISLALADTYNNRYVKQALESLVERQVLFERPASGEYCIWPKSSINLTARLESARRSVPEISDITQVVEILPEPRPVFAHRHYLTKGTPRSAAVIPLSNVNDVNAKALEIPCGSDAALYLVPAYPQDTLTQLESVARDLSLRAKPGIAFGVREIPPETLSLAKELLAWRSIETNCRELRIDNYARREVRATIESISHELVVQLSDLRAPGKSQQRVAWYRSGKRCEIQHGKELNQWLSELFDEMYNDAPTVRNEILNRNLVSSAGTAARQRLMEQIFLSAEQEDLGIKKTPPEMAVYLSILRKGNMHVVDKDGNWRIAAPPKDSDWRPAWEAVDEAISVPGGKDLQKIIEILGKPPIGLRESVSLILVTAYLRANLDELILREKGTYVTEIDSAVLARLAKRPDLFHIQMLSTHGPYREVLLAYKRETEHELGAHYKEFTLGALTREIYRWYLALPECVIRTKQLPDSHRLALGILNKADNPTELLVSSLPSALGIDIRLGSRTPQTEVNRLAACLREFFSIVSTFIDNLRDEVRKEMAIALGIDDDAPISKVRAELAKIIKPIEEVREDFTLQSLVRRTLDPERTNEAWRDSVARLFAGRTIESWNDDSLGRFRTEFKHGLSVLQRLAAISITAGRKGECGSSYVAVQLVAADGKENLLTVPLQPTGTRDIDAAVLIRKALAESSHPAELLAQLLAEFSDFRGDDEMRRVNT